MKDLKHSNSSEVGLNTTKQNDGACYHLVQNLPVSYLETCCFVWLLNLVCHNEERIQGAYKNRMLRKTFGPQTEELTGD